MTFPRITGRQNEEPTKVAWVSLALKPRRGGQAQKMNVR
jgi:hypothetical protein